MSGTVRKRRGTQDAAEEDDDALLTRESAGRWTDSFMLLRASRWAVCTGLELYRANSAGEGPGTSSGSREAKSSKPTDKESKGKKRASPEKEEEIPLKEAAIQFVSANKIPVGLMVILLLTVAIIIQGESVNRNRYAERTREVTDDHYGVLGVARDAETADVKRAYKTLAKRWHPDRNPNCTACQETFSKIATAYETLSDDAKRAAYDDSGGVATSELKSPKSVPLTRENFDELVTFSNDVWIVQAFRPDDGGCAQFHPFWENQIQKHGHLVRFGRVDVTNDQGKWLPMKIRVLPTVLKFGRHLGAVDIFPITATHETSQMLTKFVLTSFPNIGLPLSGDKSALSSWLGASGRKHKVLFAIPGKSEEERYKSHLVPRKLAALWSELFEFRTAETALLHELPESIVSAEVKAALPRQNEADQKAAVLFFPAAGGSAAPKSAAVIEWPTDEDELVLQLLKLAEFAGPALSARSAELLCRSLGIRRVYCLVLLDANDATLVKASIELRESKNRYMGEVAEIRAGGGEVSEDEDNFVVFAVRLLRQSRGLQPSVASCHAPKFGQVEKILEGAGAFLMDFDTGRVAPLSLASYRGLYPQIAYEDSLAWVDGVLDPTSSLPDCSEGLQQRFVRRLRSEASLWELAAKLMFALFLVEMLAKAATTQSLRWWIGCGSMVFVAALQSPPFQRQLALYLPNFLFAPSLLEGL